MCHFLKTTHIAQTAERTCVNHLQQSWRVFHVNLQPSALMSLFSANASSLKHVKQCKAYESSEACVHTQETRAERKRRDGHTRINTALRDRLWLWIAEHCLSRVCIYMVQIYIIPALWCECYFRWNLVQCKQMGRNVKSKFLSERRARVSTAPRFVFMYMLRNLAKGWYCSHEHFLWDRE